MLRRWWSHATTKGSSRLHLAFVGEPHVTVLTTNMPFMQEEFSKLKGVLKLKEAAARASAAEEAATAMLKVRMRS